jgi:hypothetical protein
MRIILLVFLFLLVSCSSEKKKSDTSSPNDVAVIENEITEFHQALKRAYNGVAFDTDSLLDRFFDKDAYYITYWGMAEPIDSTKVRLRHAVKGMNEYDYKIESMQVKVSGDGAYAFFILRQTYALNGVLMDEYLPTTFILERHNDRWLVIHSHRSADFQTIQQLMNIARQR